MSNCSKCGKRIGVLSGSVGGECMECVNDRSSSAGSQRVDEIDAIVLTTEAYEVGANAVVGVDLDYVELSAAGNMVLLVASGTAVVIEEKQA